MYLFGNSNWARLKGKLDTLQERIKEIKVRKFGERDMVILYLKSGHEIQRWGRILKTSCLGKAGDRERADDSGRV